MGVGPAKLVTGAEGLLFLLVGCSSGSPAGPAIPADNPFPGSPVYSLGHRNDQGLAFDSSKQPWAVDFGRNTWAELNRIVPAATTAGRWPT